MSGTVPEPEKAEPKVEESMKAVEKVVEPVPAPPEPEAEAEKETGQTQEEKRQTSTTW